MRRKGLKQQSLFDQAPAGDQVEPTTGDGIEVAVNDCSIDWTSRTEKGRARLRKRYLAIIDIMEQDLQGSDSNLLEQGEAFKVVPALLRSVIAADDKEEAAVDGGDIADAVELWLAAGDD